MSDKADFTMVLAKVLDQSGAVIADVPISAKLLTLYYPDLVKAFYLASQTTNGTKNI